jgi:hypothetical protein
LSASSIGKSLGQVSNGLKLKPFFLPKREALPESPRMPSVQKTIARLALVCGMLPIAAIAADHDSSRWEKYIARFEAADKKQMPEPGDVLFIGSSCKGIGIATDLESVPSVLLRETVEPRGAGLEIQTKGAFDRDSPISEITIVEDLHVRSGRKRIVETGELFDVAWRQLLPFGAERLPHAVEKLHPVDQLDLSPAGL